jgi:epoxyqueuosine reductase
MPQQKKELNMNELSRIEEEIEREIAATRLPNEIWTRLEQRMIKEDQAFKGERIYYATAKTEVGRILVASSAEGLCRVALPSEDDQAFWNWLRRRFATGRVQENTQKNSLIMEELQAYFTGELHEFDLKLDLRATPFQVDVLHEIARIPFGETVTYSHIAKSIGKPIARQAVGAATGSNPIPIVIPCHRVVGADGRMVGYGGGIPLKEWLLHLEGHSIEDHKLVERGLFD